MHLSGEQDLIGHTREGAQKNARKGPFWEMGAGGKTASQEDRLA